MPDDTARPIRQTRRRFVGAIAAGLASAVVGGSNAWAAPRRGGHTVRFFDVVHDPSVAVMMTNGRRFEVCVKDVATGEILERHDRVSARDLLDVESAYIRIIERAEH